MQMRNHRGLIGYHRLLSVTYWLLSVTIGYLLVTIGYHGLPIGYQQVIDWLPKTDQTVNGGTARIAGYWAGRP